MNVSPILAGIQFRAAQARKRILQRHTWVPLTGYASLGCGVASCVLAHRRHILAHKVTAMIALAAAAAHILLLKTMHGIGRHRPLANK